MNMKAKKVIISCLLLLTTGFIACEKDHIDTINQLVKDLFFFKEGSTWTYYDSVSHNNTTMTIVHSEKSKIAPMQKRGKPHYFYETIESDVIVQGGYDKKFTIEIWTGSFQNRDNTAITMGDIYTPSTTPFVFSCDKNNTFSCPMTYFPTYEVNSVIYEDVYVFDYEEVLYYVAKHVGYIRCFQADEFDLVLIDKTIY
jgi:hypothetical protein